MKFMDFCSFVLMIRCALVNMFIVYRCCICVSLSNMLPSWRYVKVIRVCLFLGKGPFLICCVPLFAGHVLLIVFWLIRPMVQWWVFVRGWAYSRNPWLEEDSHQGIITAYALNNTVYTSPTGKPLTNQWLITLPETNIAMENPPFWWYLPGKMGIFMGYVSFREGISTWWSGPTCW